MKVRTIDIIAKAWLDRPNGNSYFTARVIVNYGMKGEKTFTVPFSISINEIYKVEAMKKLSSEGVITSPEKDFELVPWRFCQENNIILRTTLIERCTRKEIENFIK